MKIDGMDPRPAETIPGASNAPVDARPQTVGADTVATDGEGTSARTPSPSPQTHKRLTTPQNALIKRPPLARRGSTRFARRSSAASTSLTRRESQSALSSSKTHSERSRKPCSLPP